VTSSLRQKLTILALVLYWPALFIGAHIPIPTFVRAAQVSDKSLHFAAYLVLAFLLWFSIVPSRKADWRKATVWWAVLVVILYGLADELLQALVGRSCDIMDFAADLAGALAGFVLFTFLAFWPALLVVTGITIFLLTNLARTNVADLLPITSVIYYLLAYGLFTILWIQHMRLSLSLRAPQLKWLIGALVLPVAFLSTVKLFSVILGKNFAIWGVVLSAVGIAAVVATVFLTALFRRYAVQKSSPAPEGPV
jgi:VanZ family protein